MASPFAPIPMPENGIDSFNKGMAASQAMWDSMMANKMRPYQQQLLKAQSEEAQGKGAQANMIAKLLQGGGASGSNLDTVAGLLHIPVTTQVIDGKIVKFNPLKGSYETMQAGETPQQKRSGETEQHIGEKGAGLGLERGEKLAESSRAYLNTADLAKRAKDILQKKPITGIGSGVRTSLNLSNDPDLATLKNIFGELQTERAHAISSRGGAQAQKQAANLKPSMFAQPEFNISQLDEIIRESEGGHKANTSEYKNVTGKELGERLGLPPEQVAPGNQAASPATSNQVYSSDPRMQKFAEEAISQGADPQAVIAEIAKLQGGQNAKP